MSGKMGALIDNDARTQDPRTHLGVENIFDNGINVLNYTNLDIGSYTAAQLGLTVTYQPVVIPTTPIISFNDRTNLVTITNDQSDVAVYYRLNEGTWNTYSIPFTLTENARVWTYAEYVYNTNENIDSETVSQYCEIYIEPSEYIDAPVITATVTETDNPLKRQVAFTVTRNNSLNRLYVSRNVTMGGTMKPSVHIDTSDYSSTVIVSFNNYSGTHYTQTVSLSVMEELPDKSNRSGVSTVYVDDTGTVTTIRTNDTNFYIDENGSVISLS